MHTVAYFSGFEKDAAEAGMTEEEVESLVVFLSENPTAGVEIPGTGGCRKFRVAGRGKGKSGGYRTITFYSGSDLPVFLVTAFGKGEKSNLSKSECNALRDITKAIVNAYRRKVA
ncbi:MAG: type II toxin-antitoxin system RelE/ParE family toxin [Hyphomicrobium sp.]|jgi:hypothetical protein